MQRISIALSALISCKQYRLQAQAASKVTKTERQITKLRRYWVPDCRACHRDRIWSATGMILLLVLILPTHGWTTRLSWPGWLG